MEYNLGNGGDIVRLFDNNDLLIDFVQYDALPPWPTAAAGNGATLELINPDVDNSQVENWKASINYGTPGQINSVYTVTALNDNEEIQQRPEIFKLSQNYPNPFNPSTIINYELPITNYVDLSIYNTIGQKVKTLVSQKQTAGKYQVEWDASGFASGVYYYRLRTNGGFVQSRKLLLLK
jgi:hypothetical protein